MNVDLSSQRQSKPLSSNHKFSNKAQSFRSVHSILELQTKMTDEIENKVINLCGDYLSGPWKEPKNVNIQKIAQGFGNRNFRCSLKSKPEDCDYPSDVIAHIYGGPLTGNDSSYRINGEAAESVIVNALSQNGIATKLYGVFDGGRIEEFISGTTCTFDDFENSEVNRLLAQKLARMHSQKIPISKVLKRVTLCKDLINILSAQTFDASKFNVMAEFYWYENIIQRISGEPVFTHGDVNPNNIIVIRDENQEVKDVMLIDYEECAYFYRSSDIAYLFNLRCVQIRNVDGKLKMIFASKEYRKGSKDIEMQFMMEYLKEWKLLKGIKDDQSDSLESLEMEVDFSRLFVHAHFVGIIKHSTDWCDPSCQEYLEIVNYDDTKQKTIAKYKDRLELYGVILDL